MTPSLWIEPPMDACEAARWTTEEERALAAAFGSARRRAEFLTWRAIVRRELGREVGITYDAAGAPVLIGSDVHISVSHCAGRVAVCASPRPCAVDIEPADRDFSRVAGRYMRDDERALSDDSHFPGIVWCAKETLYKYAGRPGLDFLEDLRIETADLRAGRLTGRIENREPVELTVRREEGYILVCIF